MADSKITALTALTAADPVNDMFPVVDVSDTSMAASGTTKKISVNNILGASGTATLASATITGDLTVDTSTLKVDSANDRVGIGTASPNNTLTVRGSQDAGIEVNSADSNSSRIITAYDPANTRFYINSTSSGSGTVLPLDFLIGNSAQYRIAASGVFTWYDGAGGTRMTLNSTGLGVGASPSYQLHVAKAQASQTAVYIDNQQNNAAASSALTLSAYGGFWNLSVPHSATFVNPLIFKFGSTEMMRLDSSGNVGIGVTPAGTGGCLQLKSGITFPATQVASSDANTLDDYEEGTWTPVVADASTGGNVGTATINSATYTKIGRQVSIQCDLRSITTTGMTGANNLFIRGLPFASVKGGNGSFYTYRVGRNASTVSSAVTVEHGVSHAILSLFTASSANTNISILVSDIVSTTSELALSVTYTV